MAEAAASNVSEQVPSIDYTLHTHVHTYGLGDVGAGSASAATARGGAEATFLLGLTVTSRPVTGDGRSAMDDAVLLWHVVHCCTLTCDGGEVVSMMRGLVLEMCSCRLCFVR